MIKNNDNNFEDEEFELEEDIDDSWDYDAIDEIDIEDNIIDEENSDDTKDTKINSTRSKRNIVKPLVITIILGSGAYLFLPLILPSNTQNQIPIIKLEETQNIYEDNIETNEVKNNITTDEPPPLQTTSLEIHNNALQVKKDEVTKETVLMPLPENIEEYAPPLAELTNIFQEDEKSQTQQIDTKQDLLSEDDLLSKTEAIFEDTPVSSVSNNEETKAAPDLNMENAEKSLPSEIFNLREQALTNDNSEDIFKETTPEPEPEPELELEAEPEANIELETTPEIISKPEPEVAKIEKSESLKDISSIEEKVEPKPKPKPKPKLKQKNNAIIAKKKPIWVIRAASSRSAIIYDKTSREMKSVEVNDIVDGIGRIKSIKLIDGIWVIRGTSGKIEQ